MLIVIVKYCCHIVTEKKMFFESFICISSINRSLAFEGILDSNFAEWIRLNYILFAKKFLSLSQQIPPQVGAFLSPRRNFSGTGQNEEQSNGPERPPLQQSDGAADPPSLRSD